MSGAPQLLLLLLAALVLPAAMLFSCALTGLRQRIHSLLWIAPIPALASRPVWGTDPGMGLAPRPDNAALLSAAFSLASSSLESDVFNIRGLYASISANTLSSVTL
jgi:hypothetical protein